eukprot:CAMPEP_0172410028 /NCGR_PEP_ID=MMETSP1061-20121228/76670_1 /TAXON_ID=37318 /ORGANISM="Pseudo-nitzschia pungens, Strain cf. pungens" /LENGTH=300 /DNA_ID=CAMNT_0013146197 /DNA_START=190 /DNA_END=1092 /DNA_ORIENTATION=+
MADEKNCRTCCRNFFDDKPDAPDRFYVVESKALSKYFLTGILAISVLALWALSVNWIIEETDRGCRQYLKALNDPLTVPPIPSSSQAPSDVPTHYPSSFPTGSPTSSSTGTIFRDPPPIGDDDTTNVPDVRPDPDEVMERIMSDPEAAEMCKKWIREKFISTNELVVLHNLTFGLVTAVVVAFLTRFNDPNNSYHGFNILCTGRVTFLKVRYLFLKLFSFLLPRCYLFFWIWFGMKCLIRGSRRGEVFGPTLYATGHAWLGSAIAIVYNMFVAEDEKDEPEDAEIPPTEDRGPTNQSITE